MSQCALVRTGPYVLGKMVYSKIKDTYVIDIGSNVGDMSEKFLTHGAEHVLCIEPSSVLCEKLSNNLIGKGFSKDKFTIMNCGVSDKEGTLKNVTFVNCWTLGTPETTALPISPGAQDVVGKENFDVSLISLDDIMDRSFIKDKDIKFIKIDVDGYEAKVLRGGKKFINKYRPIILFELSYLPVNCGDSITEMLNTIFDELNYKMYRTDGLEVSKSFVIDNFPWHTSCDVILVPK